MNYKENIRMDEILQFKLESGRLCVSDPCYKKGTWCAAWDLPAQDGLWNCYIERENHGIWQHDRIKEVVCFHSEIKDFYGYNWKQLEFDIGVDSGQCGIFDFEKYPNEEDTGAYGDLESFYGKCCNLTLSDDGYGVLENGIVTSSGYGDGSYTMFALYDESEEKLIGVKVVFIDYENKFDSEEEDCEDCNCNECELDENIDKEEEEEV
jgi:hypothetical protein